MDTSVLEHVAEDLISHELQQHGLLVAKPKFDKLGTDLIAFRDMNDGVKFCRIQCKGRSLKSSKSSNIRIPKDYVTDGFFVILFLDTDERRELYIFFPEDIRNWKCSKDCFQLSFSRPSALSNTKRLNF